MLRRGALYQTTIIICFLLSVCLCPYIAKAEHHRSLFASYKETLFHSGNGLLSDEANAIAQSHDGYLWIGSYAGLMRYNGQVFQQMKDENNQSIVRVSCLFEDSRQRLWIGTADESLYCCENGLISKKEEISASNQKAIVEDLAGKIYIAAANGVAVYNEKARIPQHWIEDPRLQHHMVVSLAAEDIGRIWGVTYDGDVFLLDDQRVIAYFDKRFFKGFDPKRVFCDKDGIVYLTTAGNVILRLDTYVNQYTDGEDLRIKTFTTGEIEDHRCLYQDQAGRLLVCARNGLGFFDRDMVFHKVEGGLFESSVEQIMQDNYGGYWLVSSNSGALHIARTRFTDISAMAMLREVTYNAVIKYQGNLYLGADNGLHILDSSYNVIRNPLTRMLRGTRVRYFAEDTDHNLWIATYRKFGLLRYKNGQWQKWGVAEGMPTNMIRTLLVRKNGDIAVGTGDGLVIMRNNAIHRIYDRDTSAIENGVILSLCEDPQGNLFIGSDGDGIYKLEKDNTIQAIPMADDGHRLGSVISMKWDTRQNGIWINNGRGIYFMRDEAIRKVDTGTLNVSNLLEVTPSADYLMEEKLYLFSSQIAQSVDVAELLDPKVEKNEKMKSYRSISYDNTLDSSLTMGACHFYAPEEQKLYLACSRNVLTLDELKNWEGAVQPRAMIDSIQIRMPDGSVSNLSYNQEIIIPQDFSQLDIAFGILSFANSNSDLYYYLEGYDTKPIHVEGKQNHEMHYSTLPGGKYVFHVLARSRDNSYQNEMSATFRKPKTLAEETWARILFVLVGGGILVRLTYLFTKKRNEKKLAEAKKEAETANHIAELEAKHAKAEQERAEAAEAKRRLEEEFTERTILTISNTIDAKDRSTNGHSRRVAQYTVEIGRMEKLSTDELRELYYAALLHDIGKIAIPDNILNKPSKLTDEEYGVIKSHTSRGANILNQIKNQRLADGAHYHHERYDGKGYPEQLVGEAIPAYGRMIAVADVVDAMYSKRVYKAGITMDVVIAELKRCAGTQLDPQYAADMIYVLERGFVADENRETVFDSEV